MQCVIHVIVFFIIFADTSALRLDFCWFSSTSGCDKRPTAVEEFAALATKKSKTTLPLDTRNFIFRRQRASSEFQFVFVSSTHFLGLWTNIGIIYINGVVYNCCWWSSFVFCFLFFFFLAGFTEVVGLSPLIFATALGFFFAITSGNNSHCDKEIYSRVVENVVLV